MIRRGLELILIAAVLVGGFFAWRTGVERAALGVEFARLAKAAGDLEIVDPSKVHVLALDTGEPMHYAWRIYVPANYNFQVRTSQGSSSSSSSSSSGTSAVPQEFLARVRVREHPTTGVVRLFESHHGGSSVITLGDNTFVARLRKQGGKVVAERLGADGVAVIDPNDPGVLLRLSFPEAPRADAKDPPTPDIYRLEFGPEKPRPPEGGATP